MQALQTEALQIDPKGFYSASGRHSGL